MATIFGQNGYQTAYFGKWHVDGAVHRSANTRPAFQHVDANRRGDFDYWVGYENNNSQYDCWVHGHQEDGTPIASYQLPTYETDALTDLLIDYLRERGCCSRRPIPPIQPLVGAIRRKASSRFLLPCRFSHYTAPMQPHLNLWSVIKQRRFYFATQCAAGRPCPPRGTAESGWTLRHD